MVAGELRQPALFQDTWLSYCGAVAGALHALGIRADVVDTAGYAGLAFLVNVTEGWTDPSSPTLHSSSVGRTSDAVVALWAEMSRGAASLGARIEHWWDPEQYRYQTALPDRQRARARRLYDRVRQSIDAGRPVVVWGLAAPEYGLVNGYDDEHYQASTFRRYTGQPEDPIRWDSLQARGGLEALFFEPAPHAPPPDDRAAVARGLSLARGDAGPIEFETPGHPVRERQRYVSGPAAYEAWAQTLTAGTKGTLFYEYNSYNAACLHAAKEAQTAFLRRLASRHALQAQSEPLRRAADAYAAAEAELRGLTQLCPYGDTGDLSPAQCRQGAELLRAARPHEEAALTHLAAALAAWS